MNKLITKSIIYLLFFSLSTSIYCQIDSGFVQIKGGVLFYRIWGEGEPLVFLNGGPLMASNGYEVYAEELSAVRKIILFDQRGTGKSKLKNNPLHINFYDMIGDLEKLREHLKIEKWDVFGHSFGGEYALNYTVKHKDHINKLILSAAMGAETSRWKRNNWQNFLAPDSSNILIAELQLKEAYYEEIYKNGPDSEKARRFNGAFKARYYVSKAENVPIVMDWWLNKSFPAGDKLLRRRTTDPQLVSSYGLRKLKKFEQPVLIIHGMGDFLNITNPLQNHAIFPNST